MKKHFLAFAVVILSIPQVARAADELMPASSEDLEQFDQILANQNQKQPDVSAKRDNFGAAVKAEAQKLKDAGASDKSDLGKFVSGQKRQNDLDSPGKSDERG